MKAIILAGFLGIVGLVGGWESKYTKVAVCSDIVEDVVTFTDNSGNCWEWELENGEHFEIGNAYRLVMDDNHTSNIYDDWIYKIKKN